MEIKGDVGNGSAKYLAVAFGSSSQMQDAEMYYCTGRTFRSGVIVTQYLHPTTDQTLTVRSTTSNESYLSSDLCFLPVLCRLNVVARPLLYSATKECERTKE